MYASVRCVGIHLVTAWVFVTLLSRDFLCYFFSRRLKIDRFHRFSFSFQEILFALFSLNVLSHVLFLFLCFGWFRFPTGRFWCWQRFCRPKSFFHYICTWMQQQGTIVSHKNAPFFFFYFFFFFFFFGSLSTKHLQLIHHRKHSFFKKNWLIWLSQRCQRHCHRTIVGALVFSSLLHFAVFPHATQFSFAVTATTIVSGASMFGLAEKLLTPFAAAQLPNA